MQYSVVLNQMIQWLASFSAWEGWGGEVKRRKGRTRLTFKNTFSLLIFLHISSLTLVIANQKMQLIHQVIGYCIIIFFLFIQWREMLHLFGCMPSSETSSGKTFQKWFNSLIKLVDQIDRYFLRWQRRLYTLMCTAKSSRTILKSWFRSYIKQDVLGISSEIQLVQKSSFVPHQSV